MHIHVLGICGTFMAGIASIAKELGHKVTGCDQNVYPPMSIFLDSLEVEVTEGYKKDQISKKPDLFIVGNVISRGNELMEEILDQNLAYQSGPEWLYSNVLRNKWVIAVSGTHGKTTTSSMINWILSDQNYDPGFLIGGIPGNFKTSSQLSKSDSPFFVIEADEYDTAFFDKRSKFVHYHPKTLVINNIEFDHADIFENIDQIKKHFHQLIRTIPSIGKVIANKQDKNIETLLTQGVWSELDFFNTIESWHHKKEDNKNHIYKQDKLLGELKWDLMGEYNVHNALAAIAAVSHVGVSPNDAINSLKSFKNTTRRMQLIFQSEEIRIYDDFAHHPTAIKSVIEAFKQKYPEEKSLIVLDPRSNTMKRGDLKEDLKRTLEMADAVTIFSKNLMWDITSVKTDKNNISLISDQVENIFEFIKNNQSKFNNIIMLSNGSFDGLTKKITDYFENEKK